MMARCYNSKSGSFKNYGALGITVTKRWHELDNFIEDLDKIEGFQTDLFMNSEIQLDKDIKQKNVDKKIYSLETTCFVSRSENAGARNNNRSMVFVSPNGRIYYSSNRESFCREHNISSRSIFNVLRKQLKHYKGWQCFYEEDFEKSKILPFQKVKAVDAQNNIYYFNNISVFAKENGLSAPNISQVLAGTSKTHKGWKFELITKGMIVQ